MENGERTDADFQRALSKLEKTLGCRFKNIEIITEALTHSSFANELPAEKDKHYERLEFLGDAVLELAVSTVLFEMRPDEGEGNLTRRRADLVNKKKLAEIAGRIGLGSILRLGSGERKTGGADNPSILASALEAVIGAVYLDRGWKTSVKVIEKLFGEEAKSQQEDLRDPRSILQEWAQAEKGSLPQYKYLPPDGPPHKRIYSVEISIEGKFVAGGSGGSKKEACNSAATAALEKIMPERYNKQ